MDRLKRQIDFILEVDKIKSVFRQSFIADGSRRENDSEHSWHLALMAMILSEYSNVKIDVSKVIYMVLIHDIVEIDAGDTYAYDDEGNKTKEEREIKAAERIFNILPEDQAVEIRAFWDEFEEGVTPEAKFAAALDRMQPVLLNDISGGITWKEHGVNKDKVVNRNSAMDEGASELWSYCKNLIEKNVLNGNIIN